MLRDGSRLAGEVTRAENFRPGPDVLAKLGEKTREEIADHEGFARRTLYRTGNFDLYNDDFRWVVDYEITGTSTPRDIFFVERMEWGPFIGTIKSVDLNGKVIEKTSLSPETLTTEQTQAAMRRDRIKAIERGEIGAVNHYLEAERLKLKKVGLKYGHEAPQYIEAEKGFKTNSERLETQYQDLAKEVAAIKEKDAQYTITLADVGGREKTLKLSDIVRFYPANELTFSGKVGIYLSRWWEFLSQEPREANTEGGVMPAIFGYLLHDNSHGAFGGAFWRDRSSLSPGICQARASGFASENLRQQSGGCPIYRLRCIRPGVLCLRARREY